MHQFTLYMLVAPRLGWVRLGTYFTDHTYYVEFASNMCLLCFQVVQPDFVAHSSASNLKVNEIKQLNNILKDLRQKVRDMDFDSL